MVAIRYRRWYDSLACGGLPHFLQVDVKTHAGPCISDPLANHVSNVTVASVAVLVPYCHMH